MLRKISYIVMFLLHTTFPLFGQVVDGFVFDETDSTAIANVLVKINDDNSIFTLTNNNGYFKFDSIALKENNVISLSHMSFTPLITSLKKNGSIYFLKSKSEMLKEVVIESNWIYRKEGVVVVDFGKMQMEQNMQLSDALRHIPGIVKDTKGHYSLGGKEAVVYVNNIRQNISAQSLESFLESLPASIVANVELTFVNSGKYSASTEAVININTKSNIPLGQSIQPYVFTSVFPHGMYDTGGNLFYMIKKSKWLYNGTLSYSNERIYKLATDSLLYKGLKILDDYNYSDGRNNVITYRGSAIYEFLNLSRLTFNTFLYYDKGYTRQIWDNFDKNQYSADKHSQSDLYNFSLSYILPSTSKKMFGNITYSFSYGNDNSNYNYISKAETYKSSKLMTRGYMNTLNVDLNTELKSFLFSYGLQFDYNKVRDNVNYSYINASANNYDELFSGRELLTSLYAQARYKFSKQVSARLGMRLENTDYRYSTVNNSNNNNYCNWFPSFLTYIDLKNYSSIIGIVSNINRPKYSWIVNGNRQVNDMVSMLGNRELRPNKAYGVVFYNTIFDYFNVNLSYVLTYDYIGNVFSVTDNRLYSTYQNIADQRTLKSNVVIPYRLANNKILGQVQLNLAYDKLYHLKNQFTLPTNRKSSYFNYNIHSNISFSPTNRFFISMDGNYNPPYKSALMESTKNGSLDFEIQYLMLKEKNLQLRFSLNDLFAKDMKRVFFYDNGQYFSLSHKIGPIFRLSIKYVFNKGQKVVDEYNDYSPSNNRFR